MTLSAELGKRIVAMQYEDLPAEAIRWAKISLVDTLGCAFAGVDDEGPRIARGGIGGRGEARVIPAREQALAAARVARCGVRAAQISADDFAPRAQFAERPRDVGGGEKSVLPIRRGIRVGEAVEIDGDVEPPSS